MSIELRQHKIALSRAFDELETEHFSSLSRIEKRTAIYAVLKALEAYINHQAGESDDETLTLLGSVVRYITLAAIPGLDVLKLDPLEVQFDVREEMKAAKHARQNRENL